jgi:hypothetical protein
MEVVCTLGMANIHRCLGYIDIFQKNIDIFTSMLAFRYIVENIDVFVSIYMYLKMSLIAAAIQCEDQSIFYHLDLKKLLNNRE